VNAYGSAPQRILLDAETRIVAIDGMLASDLGHDVADLLGVAFSRLVAADEVTEIGADLVQLVTDEAEIVTSRRTLIAAEGTPVEAVLSAERRLEAGDFAGFSVAVLIDDAQLSLPAALPDHLRRLDTPAALVDADGCIFDTNLAWGRLFSSPQAVTPGGDMYELVHADEREILHERFGELTRGSVSSMRLELRCLAEPGPFWCRLSMASFDTRASLFTVTAEDISAEHLTNRVLLANESLFRSLAESSPVGLARLGPDLSITYSSPRWREMTGEGPDDPHLDMASLLHPAGRSDALAALQDRIAEESAEPVVARLAASVSTTEWVSLRIGPVSDDELGLIGHVVTIEDVSQLVSANESTSQLAGIVESTSDLVGIADLRTGAIVYLNGAAAELFSPGGVEEVDLNTLYGPEGITRYLDDVYPVLRRGDTWTGELDMVRADGKVVKVLQTVAAEIGPDGEPERASALGRDVSNEREALDELAYQATHDALTGLPNRSLLIDHLELALARSARDDRPVGVLFVDLDRFKIVNDTYGHDTGDKLLKELADRMAAVLRPSDTVARLGGDEFVVLCEDIEGEIDALAIADRIRTAIDDTPVRIGDIDLQVGTSIGIAISTGAAGREPDSLLQRADAAMYRAKEAGRGRTELFDDVLRDRAQRRNERTEQLEHAIDMGALDVHYQPLVDLQSGRVVGVEALVRWLHPTSGLLGPSEFLALAVQTGLVGDLDALVIDRACRDAARWGDDLGPSSPAVHVNVDGSTLLSGRLADVIGQTLADTRLPSDKLVLEFSEAFLMANGDATIDALAAITDVGVAVAIDDVGLGATRLPRLGRFAADMLKIDGSLTNDVGENPTARSLIRSVVALGQALDLSVGAEAVEAPGAIAILRELGVDLAQGHVFSGALPVAKIEPLLTLRSTLARNDR
jgi:diguanylate cyclase (GGDEF)-like protein